MSFLMVYGTLTIIKMKMPVIQLIGVLDTSEAIPNHNPYTFSNDTLYIGLFFGNTWQYLVTFECDENIVSFGNTTFD